MPRRRLLIALTLSCLLPACAGEEGISSAPTTPKRSEAPSPTPEPGSPTPEPEAPGFQMKSLAVSPARVTLTSDATAPLSDRTATFTAIAVGTSSQQVTTAVWATNPGGRLIISQAGVATVLSGAPAGLVEVLASSGSYRATASVAIAATLPKVQGVQLSSSELSLYVPAPDQLNTAGYPTSAQLTATVLLSDASTEQAVSWSASPADVARVDATGRVTALRKGTAVVTARSLKDSTYAAQCTLTVQAKTQVEVDIR